MALGKVNKPWVYRDVFGFWWRSGMQAGKKCEEPKGAPHSHWMRWHEWIKNHVTYDKGELINMRTVTIELRFDADEEEKHEVLKVAAMQAAKHLFTSALLISSKRKPQIAMYTSDMFAGQQEIELAETLTELLPE